MCVDEWFWGTIVVLNPILYIVGHTPPLGSGQSGFYAYNLTNLGESVPRFTPSRVCSWEKKQKAPDPQLELNLLSVSAIAD